jgi:predicted MFS family arabinose efflux permease
VSVHTTVPLRDDPDFRRYWGSRVVSVGGSMVTYVVLPVLVYRMTQSSVWTAAVAAAEALPYLCFGLIAGAMADRLDRKRQMIVADLLSAALLASVPIAYEMGVLTPWQVVGAGFGVQSLFVFFDAANFGALPALVGRDRLAVANSTVHGSTTVLELSVPAGVGALLAFVAPALLLTVGAVTFIASALFIRAIVRQLRPVRREQATRIAHDIREGLRFVVHHPVVRVQTMVGVVVCMSLGTFAGQFVPWLDKTLGVPPDNWRIGVIFSAWGVGGLVASVAFPAFSRAVGAIRTTLVLLPVSCAFGVVAVLARHWVLAAALIALWAVPVMIIILNAVTLRQIVTPDRFQSRVNTAARMTTFGLGTPLGAVLGGFIGSRSGPDTAMFVGAALLGVAGLLAWASPLRGYRLDPAAVAAPVD